MEKVTHLRCRTQGSLTSEVMEFGGGFNLINLGPSANGNLSIWAYAKKGQELTYAIGQSNQFSAAYIRIYKVEGNN